MSPHRDPSARADRLLMRHRERLQRIVQRPLRTPTGPAVSAATLQHLRQQAEELYWNELAWERLTSEETVGGSRLVEFMFPGFLAFVDGLLLRETTPDSPEPARPRPLVVEEVLRFLAGRCVALAEDSRGEAPVERAITGRLIDLVLYRLYALPVEGVERLDAAHDE